MEPGWVAVVLSDPACGNPGGGPLKTRITIPSTGYVCTSLPDARGYVVDHFYREMPDGSLRELDLDKEIFVPAITEIKGGPCRVVAKTFWYGPRDKMQGDPSVVIRKNRKECQ